MYDRRWMKTVSLLAFATTMAYAEPSVYGHSYSSGSAQVKRNTNAIYSLKEKIARQQEEIDGLKSLIESLSQQVNRLTASTKPSRNGSADESKTIRQLQERVARLEKRLGSGRSTQKTRSASVARKRSTLSQAGTTQSSSKKATRKTSAGSGGNSYLQKAPSAKLFSRGVRLINQKKYSDAKLRFDILLTRHYKPASSNFYEGEIAYRTGHYDEAIKYYQKSAELNENAVYMDRLLLHTALSLEKSGDKEQARNFFQAIVDGYPGTTSARIAKKHLK
ncbi:tetratricopeptide repeat protein [Nitratifractor sp.]|uniref:tetratricopeptide repeat protein n=1 Tax=Nitratifractor sp. TaxID=2268144 RepID=UPI0025E131D4|nr:tetratricopeptide repeat protein [Nitratifractor sp.]